MTTQAEIRKWARPFMDQHPAMVQAKHFVLFRPIGHLLRTLAFWGGSDRHNLNPGWLLCPMCIPPGLMNTFGNHIPVGYTNWPGFQDIFYERMNRAIDQYLLPHATLQDFHDLAWTSSPFMVSLRNLPKQNAVLLAALGRFEEAETTLSGPHAELERQAVARLAQGRALLAKRANSRAGQFDVEVGESDGALAVELGRLLACLRASDAATIAALLREWEQRNVAAWGIEQYWQPTPFPFETG